MASNHEYNMRHAKRGIALIINNEIFDNQPRREGTVVDGQNIRERLEELEFDVEYCDNLNAKETKAKLREVAGREQYHSNADCFVCVILSHGDEGIVSATDLPLDINQLVDPFKGHVCESLAGKPKIFFIQACRGQKFDDGATVRNPLGVVGDSVDDEVVTYKIPSEADFLMAYSTVPGFYAWRNKSNGSCFIQALCAVLKEYGTTLDLMTMMTRVNQRVAYEFESETGRPLTNMKKQIPCITSMLTKDVYFHPKN